MTTLLSFILFPLICLFSLDVLPFQWTPVTSFCTFLKCFPVVSFTFASLSLCYIVKLTYFVTGEGSDSVFSGHYRTMFSGFLWEGRDANVSTLYNNGQLCIYCLFIVDLYMKRNEYIIYIYIYLYIMKPMTLFLKLHLKNDHFHGSCTQSTLF